MVDYYSGFVEINLLQNGKLKFSRHGIPDKLMEWWSTVPLSSNSHKIMDSSTKEQVHIPCSLMVWQRKLFKQLRTWLRKPSYLALLKNTPISGIFGSPPQRFMGWRTKTLLPTTTKLLQLKLINPQSAFKKLSDRKIQQKFFHDCYSAALKSILKATDKTDASTYMQQSECEVALPELWWPAGGC